MDLKKYHCRYCEGKSYTDISNRRRHELAKHPEQLQQLKFIRTTAQQELKRRKLEKMNANLPNDLRCVEYLQVDHFRRLMQMNLLDDKIALCCSVLYKSIFLYGEGTSVKLYVLDPLTIVYKEQETDKSLEARLQSIIACFISESLSAVLSRHPQFFNMYCTTKEAQKFFLLLREKHYFGTAELWKGKLHLPVGKKLDNDITGLHFLNGRLNLEIPLITNDQGQLFLHPEAFKPRVLGEHYIAHTINYELVLPFSDDITPTLNEIFHFLSQIIVEREALHYILMMIGRSLIAPTLDCEFFYFYGTGGTGKTTLMNLIKQTFAGVFYEFRSMAMDSLAEANNSMMGIKDYHRFIFWEEPTEKPKMTSPLNTLCDGEIVCRQIHSNAGDIRKKCNAKLICAANYTGIWDFGDEQGGINRRLRYYKCKNPIASSQNDNKTWKHNVYDNIRKSAFIYLLLYHMHVSFSRPANLIQTGHDIFSIPCFIAMYLEPRHGLISLDDFYLGLAKHYPDSRIAQIKDKVLIQLQKFATSPNSPIPNITIDKKLNAMTLDGRQMTGAIIGLGWKAEIQGLFGNVLNNGEDIPTALELGMYAYEDEML
jgi:hypothetical protein